MSASVRMPFRMGAVMMGMARRLECEAVAGDQPHFTELGNHLGDTGPACSAAAAFVGVGNVVSPAIAIRIGTCTSNTTQLPAAGCSLITLIATGLCRALAGALREVTEA